MNRKTLIAGSILGLTAVVLGAFGSHILEAIITKDSMETFWIGIRYQIYHALLLLFVGATDKISRDSKKLIFVVITIGIILFSGSLYGLATKELTGIDFKIVGFITPIGGILLIVSWIIMLLDFLKLKEE